LEFRVQESRRFPANLFCTDEVLMRPFGVSVVLPRWWLTFAPQRWNRAFRVASEYSVGTALRRVYRRRQQSGEANYAVPIEPGDLIVTGDGRTHRVVSVVPVDEEKRSFDGLLIVEAASFFPEHESPRGRSSLNGSTAS
jgi:hypothetical protein